MLPSGLFSLACYDCYEFAVGKLPSSPEEVLHLISSIAAKQGLSGFCYYTTPNAGEFLEYPYNFMVVAYNPLKGHLKARQLEYIDLHHGRKVMRAAIKDELAESLDVDLKTFGLVELVYKDHGGLTNPVGFQSLYEVAMGSQDRLSPTFREIKELLNTSKVRSTAGAPSISLLFASRDYHLQNALERVSYFGLMQEALVLRLKWEYAYYRNNQSWFFDDIGGGLPQVLAHRETLINFLDLMNFKHVMQSGLADKDEDPDLENNEFFSVQPSAPHMLPVLNLNRAANDMTLDKDLRMLDEQLRKMGLHPDQPGTTPQPVGGPMPAELEEKLKQVGETGPETESIVALIVELCQWRALTPAELESYLNYPAGRIEVDLLAPLVDRVLLRGPLENSATPVEVFWTRIY